MNTLNIPKDAFSHGQIRSKIWLSDMLSAWSDDYFKSPNFPHTIHWYGSWVGVGAFILLQNSKIIINQVHLYDLTSDHLEISKNLLNYWQCKGCIIQTHQEDINKLTIPYRPNQLFINTSCEHLKSSDWLNFIPSNNAVLLQSTNMQHAEHVNSPKDLNDFVSKYSPLIEIKHYDQIEFNYPDKNFSRFMLYGIRK